MYLSWPKCSHIAKPLVWYTSTPLSGFVTHLHPSWPRPPRGSMRAWRTLEHTERERERGRERGRQRERGRERERKRQGEMEGGREGETSSNNETFRRISSHYPQGPDSLRVSVFGPSPSVCPLQLAPVSLSVCGLSADGACWFREGGRRIGLSASANQSRIRVRELSKAAQRLHQEGTHIKTVSSSTSSHLIVDNRPIFSIRSGYITKVS